MQRSFIHDIARALYHASMDKKPHEVDAIVTRACVLLRQKRALRHAPELFAELEQIHLTETGRVEAVVTSKHPLTQSEKKELIERLEHIYRKSVELKEHIDARLLGGFKVRCGDSSIDATLDMTLQQLSSHLTSNV